MKRFAQPLLLSLVLLCTAGPGPSRADSCPGDLEGDNQVTVDELLQAVTRALNGCPPAIVLGGPFDGEGMAIRSQCLNPADNDSFSLPQVTVHVDEQIDSRFLGRLTGKDDEGEELDGIFLEGSVDADGVVRGRIFDDEGDIDGQIRGNLSGNGLALAVDIVETDNVCRVAATLLTERRP
jgi:hypothetical protein